MAAKGGFRPGAGRKKGGLNKATVARAAEVVSRAGATVKAGDKLPLDVMLEALHAKYRKDGAEAAFALAVAAAPYLHPRLQSVDANVSGDLTVEVVRFGDGKTAK